MYTPRLNWVLFGFFSLATIGVFAAALISLPFREIAYAPVWKMIIPPPAPVVVSVLYSTEKEAWLNEIIVDFERTNPTIDGHPIRIELEKMGSWEINAAVLDGTRQPDIVSPASSLQIAGLQDASSTKFGHALVNPADTSTCRSVVKTLLVLVAWKERADVLWGRQANRRASLRSHQSPDTLRAPLG
jgi:Bacterial extracellular solute-binding protein